MKHPVYSFILIILVLLAGDAAAYNRQDSLRGGNGRGRDWWDVQNYQVQVKLDSAKKEISGRVIITFKVSSVPSDSMQIDLQEGLELTHAEALFTGYWDVSLDFVREGNVYWIKKTKRLESLWPKKVGQTTKLLLSFKGKPKAANNPPWDGGFIWTKDSTGKPWISVACQGLGASSWWPCKDYQGDEPNLGVRFVIENYPPSLGIVSNGRSTLVDTLYVEDPFDWSIRERRLSERPISTGADLWEVKSPINTYNTTFYIGDYVHWQDTFHGEKGVLNMDFYPLSYNFEKSMKQWRQAKEMLRCFEWWMGPYPFYEDGYKLVEAPFLGMEHQSAIAYGNGYKNGYRLPNGIHTDRSGTGVGFSFDFIIVHESGHEWFGNSITARDIADNWIHEGFTTYTETLFAEWIRGKDSAFTYVMGQQKNIRNDRPVIGDYGVQDDGSFDKYDKGAQVVHMIRMMLNDDKRFRELLRGLNKDFYHKIVTSKEVEEYISKFVGKELKPFFDVYLRTTQKPVLRYTVEDSLVKYSWQNAVPGFRAPVRMVLRSRNAVMTTSAHGYFRYSGVTPQDVTIEPVGWYDVVRGE